MRDMMDGCEIVIDDRRFFITYGLGLLVLICYWLAF